MAKDLAVPNKDRGRRKRGRSRKQDPVNRKSDAQEVLNVLRTYRNEAENAKIGGLNQRRETWRKNWDAYWGRKDFSKKAPWQSKLTLSEVPVYVDRFAASVREALIAAGEWWDVSHPVDQNNVLVPHIKRAMRWILSETGRNVAGQPVDFTAEFEVTMKQAAITALCGTVVWKKVGNQRGYVAFETQDPQLVDFDPTGRGLYRRRRYEIDYFELKRIADQTDASGERLFDKEELDKLWGSIDVDVRTFKERASGHGEDQDATNRITITLEEWLCTLVFPDRDRPVIENVLCVVANDQHLIRGPEPNPFWHQRDWTVFASLINVPDSVYGRSYLDMWRDVADAFIETTNLLIDGSWISMMKAFALKADMLEDPEEARKGFWPGRTFELTDDADISDFMKEIDLGNLPSEAITVWQGLKTEMREGAQISELSLAQVPPKGDITATEIAEVSRGGQAVVRSMARTTESHFLEPTLTLIWQTALQMIDWTSQEAISAVGEETARMIAARKKEFSASPVRFRVTGLSGVIDRNQRLRAILQWFSVISQNDQLLALFMRRYSMDRLFDLMAQLFGVDTQALEPSEIERTVQGLENQIEQFNQALQGRAGANGRAPAPGANGEIPFGV